MMYIKQLFSYPVAGMQGFEVDSLTINPENISGNKIFAVIATTQLDQWRADPENYWPLRMTQVGTPQLALFETANVNGTLQLRFKDDLLNTGLSFELENADQQSSSLIPVKVSRSSQTPRWAAGCGDEIARWLSAKLGKECRLIKAVANPDSSKHHFTWYTDLHFITAASLLALSREVGEELDIKPFRPNGVIEGSEPFEEENWTQVSIDGVEFNAKECERCGYTSVDNKTGQISHSEVLINIVKNHQKNFGVYFSPTNGSATVKRGDKIIVKS